MVRLLKASRECQARRQNQGETYGKIWLNEVCVAGVDYMQVSPILGLRIVADQVVVCDVGINEESLDESKPVRSVQAIQSELLVTDKFLTLNISVMSTGLRLGPN